MLIARCQHRGDIMWQPHWLMEERTENNIKSTQAKCALKSWFMCKWNN